MCHPNSINFLKKVTLLFVLFANLSFIYSQESQKVWDLLLNNDRVAALEIVKKKSFVNDVETLITRHIVYSENGIWTPDADFLKKFAESEEAEPYLFAYWNYPFIFSDYLDSGYNSLTLENMGYFAANAGKFDHIKNQLYYIGAIRNRYLNNWDVFQAYDDKINCIREWEYCGAFENLNNSGLTYIYEPESNADSNATFDAKSNGALKWYDPPKLSGGSYQFFDNHAEYGDAVNYGQTFINSEISQRVHLKLGRKGATRVWLNDVMVFESDKDITTEMDAVIIELTLQRGINRLLIKLASEDSTPYFIARMEDLNGDALTNISEGLTDRNYTPSTAANVNPVIVENPLEVFFKEKQERTSTNNFLYDYSLFKTYLRNSNHEKAKAVILPWLVKYPKSSLLMASLMQCYEVSGDDVSSNELKKNMQLNDPSYYLSQLSELQDVDALLKKDLETFDKTINRIINSTDIDFLKYSGKIFMFARRSQLDSVEHYLDRFVEDPRTMSGLKISFIDFYKDVLGKGEKTIMGLERILDSSVNYQATLKLSRYYENQNRKSESLNVIKNVLDRDPGNNTILYDYINKLHRFKMFEESIPYIDSALKNYPYSATFFKLKGDALLQTNKKQEAIAFYEKALKKNTTNNSIRKKIADLKNIKDPIDKLQTDNLYDYIKSHRNKITSNNYGMNILLDEMNVVAYEEGGGRYKGTYIYEVTSQTGIETLTEYDLDLSGSYSIYKSEIVKPDGSVVPAERSGSSLVFNGLAVGDAILIHFESNFTRSGRFYKDFVDYRPFESYHPVVEKTYRVITRKDDLKYKAVNGDLNFKNYESDSYKVYEWTHSDSKGLALYEDYMPYFSDVAKHLHISSIDSWNEVAKWYSDLVRSQIIIDEDVKSTFASIFPKGITGLSEVEKARRIYNYITSDFTYSFVDFKQSGYVPQKPSKTIKSKLGDCKDFSTLFVALAREADLQAQLVLVLTSDYGQRALVLPSTDFNHCIVKVTLDGTEQFLELTDKYLPFQALPTSLSKALGLEIPYSSNTKKESSLFLFDDVLKKQSTVKALVNVKIGEENSQIELTSVSSGHLSSYYRNMFAEPSTDVLKENLTTELKNRTSSDITVNSFEPLISAADSDVSSYVLRMTLNEKVNSIGSIRTFELPFFLNPYTQDLMQWENRKYGIDYNQYENAAQYEEAYTLELENGFGFIEVPENIELTFEDHSYSVVYKLSKPNTLTITINAIPGTKDIAVASYADFKDFVKNVMNSRRQLIAFKPQ